MPADAKAVIVSPQLVTARAIQLTPAYTSGPALENGAVIPQERTAVPLEWDDLRDQLEKLTNALQPTEPGGVSTLGQFVNTAADNLRGQGANIRETVTSMAKALSALGDHSDDTFATLKNLSTVVSALEDSSDLLGQLNRNLATVTGLVADDPGAVGAAVNDLNSVVAEATQFVKDNREAAGIATDRLASITTAVNGSTRRRQAGAALRSRMRCRTSPTSTSRLRARSPACSRSTISPTRSAFLCGAIEAASRLNAVVLVEAVRAVPRADRQEPADELPAAGREPVRRSAQARPNEITYSEDRLRPDFVPPQRHRRRRSRRRDHRSGRRACRA